MQKKTVSLDASAAVVSFFRGNPKIQQERQPVPSDTQSVGRSTRYHMPSTAHKKQEKLRAKKAAHTHRERYTDRQTMSQTDSTDYTSIEEATQDGKLPELNPFGLATPFGKVKQGCRT